MTDKRNLWYFGLEPLQERYTYQLSEQWIPETFKPFEDKINFIHLRSDAVKSEISVGQVLDACGRGIYSLGQCQRFLKAINEGLVKNNDIILLQDFWTPGLESIIYALDLYGIKVKIYSMLHAQSVDEYDFTHKMKDWMRWFELGIDSIHSGIFVGSTIHKEQLRQAGFKAPIHVVGLPIHKELAFQDAQISKGFTYQKQNQVVFTSRFDKEKNPFFMMQVAEEFLNQNPDYKFIVTTSAKDFRSNWMSVVDAMNDLAQRQPRFVLAKNLTKTEYYQILVESKVQFNTSLQDYVSWTLIESTLFGCEVCYPEFRSFPEILSKDDMYKAFNKDAALELLNKKVRSQRVNNHQSISSDCDLGRRLEAYIMMNDISDEFNIWHERELISKIID